MNPTEDDRNLAAHWEGSTASKAFRLLLAAFGFAISIPVLLTYDGGRWDQLFVVVGALFVLSGILLRDAKIAGNVFLISFSSYAGIFLFNLLLILFDVNSTKDYFHMYTQDEKLGYRLTPNWEGNFDDGYSKGKIKINSLGQRDEDLASTDKIRVLLLGDSFTFGATLDQNDTIDKKIESTCNDFDAYNLGVGGYGLPAIIETYRRVSLDSEHVYYLFFGNDLREDNFFLPEHFIVHDGYLLNRRSKLGKRLTDTELTSLIEEELRGKPFSIALQFRLERVRDLVSLSGNVPRSGSIHLLSGYENHFSNIFTEKAVKLTMELKDLVEARHARFTVVIIPTMQEAKHKIYSEPVSEYLLKMRTAGIATMELLPELTLKDYWLHDKHFSPSGAQRTASAICRNLKTTTR